MHERHGQPDDDIKEIRSNINKVSNIYNRKNVVKSVKGLVRSPVVSTNTKALAIDIALTATNNNGNSVIQPFVRIMNSYKLLKVATLTVNVKRNAIIVVILAIVLLLFIVITVVMMVIAVIVDKITFWN